MPETVNWITLFTPIIVAIIAVSGVALTVFASRRTGNRLARNDAMSGLRSENESLRDENRDLKKLHLRGINYAGRLRADIENGKQPPPEPWPDNLYDA